jgi:hypothetical protein
MDFDELKSRVKMGLKIFLINDRTLLNREAHERSITSKLASYLMFLFPNHFVDAEYNREGFGRESMRIGIGDYATPDILIHGRGVQEHNLLVIEAKKKRENDSTQKSLEIQGLRPPPLQWNRDIERIFEMIERHHYHFGLFLFFRREGIHRGCELTWFNRSEESDNIRERDRSYISDSEAITDADRFLWNSTFFLRFSSDRKAIQLPSVRRKRSQEMKKDGNGLFKFLKER